MKGLERPAFPEPCRCTEGPEPTISHPAYSLSFPTVLVVVTCQTIHAGRPLAQFVTDERYETQPSRTLPPTSPFDLQTHKGQQGRPGNRPAPRLTPIHSPLPQTVPLVDPSRTYRVPYFGLPLSSQANNRDREAETMKHLILVGACYLDTILT